MAETVQSVERAFTVLLAFDEDRPALSVTELATATGLTRPTTHRLVTTLEHLGFVRRRDGRVELTPSVLRIGSGYLASHGLARQAQPILDRLTAEVGEHASVAVLDGDDVVSLAASNSPQSRYLAVAVQAGQRLPAAKTALGRVLLAHSPERDRTAESPTVTLELDQIVADGYVVNDGRLESGLRAIGVPVSDRQGRVVASLAIAASAHRVSVEEMVDRFLPPLLTASRDLASIA